VCIMKEDGLEGGNKGWAPKSGETETIFPCLCGGLNTYFSRHDIYFGVVCDRLKERVHRNFKEG